MYTIIETQISTTAQVSMWNRKNWGEIVADSVGIILASHDTISSSLTFATYTLAANPEVQERLANEIYKHFENNPVSNVYIDIILFVVLFYMGCLFMTVTYMYDHMSCSMVLEETLRMYLPPAV